MQHRNGDLFTTDARIIAHGANTKGVMGAGIAKTIRERYPRNYSAYNKLCNDGLAVPGEWFGYSESCKIIVNLFSQDLPGPNAKYEWVFSSLMDFARFYSGTDMRYGKVIAIPEIGSGIGGLEFKYVERILQTVEDIYPEIEFEVWHYE